MSFRFLATLFCCLFLTAVVSAEWHSFDGSTEPSDMQVKVLKSDRNAVKLELTIPGYHMDTVQVDGKTCTVIRIPGASYLMEKGYPLLPEFATLVKINNTDCAKVKILSMETAAAALSHPIIPSKGHFTRDIDPASVAIEFGPVYNENVFFVAENKQISLGEEFVMRDVRGVRLQFHPVIANHVSMRMRIIKKAVVAVNMEGVSSVNTLSNVRTEAPAKVFSELYDNCFVNYSAESSISGQDTVAEDNKKLVVVTPTQFESLLGEWLSYKRSVGYTVTVKTITNETSAQIKTYLQQEYDANKFGYVVLIGDVDTLPTLTGKFESAASDRCYVRLAGADNYADAFISRISGNATEITTQLNKVLAYEKNAPSGDWWRKGITIASGEGNPTDMQRAKWLVNGGTGSGEKHPVMEGGLKGIGYTSFSENYGSSASATKVGQAVNAGAGIICYIGHGSETTWVTSGFSNTNVKSLTNGDMLPVIWSVACVNGKFTLRECFCEAWLRQPNGGAVAMEGASTNEAWDPPITKQAATVNAYIKNSNKTFGALEMAGCIEGMKVWGDGDKGQGNQMTEQCNLFGDCTMVVRFPVKGE